MSLSVAVIGAGPAGFYATDALTRKAPGARIDLIERLPTPYGLIRSGVAPDHQTTKNVTRVFDRTAAKEGVRYLGNVEVGRDVSLAELQGIYDAVVLAFGAERDRRLGIPGEDKAGVLGSMEFVGWYNGHPDFTAIAPDLSASTVAVIGNGNVAIDVARILARSEAELAATDIADHAAAALRQCAVRDVHVFGRRGPNQASFTNVELREMGELERAVALCHPDQVPAEIDPGLEGKERRLKEANLKCFRAFAEADPAAKPVRVHFEFFASPVAVLGAERVAGLRLERTRLEDGRAVGSGEFFELDCGLVVTCVGYECRGLEGVALDRGKVVNDEGRVAPGLYAVGWAKRGPTGTIGTNRPDAQDVVARLIADLGDGGGKPGPDGLSALLRERQVRVVSYDDWDKINAAEVARAAAAAPRRKLVRVADMLAALGP